MKDDKPTTRVEADKPVETEHLDNGEQAAMELSGDVEHTTGQQKEDLTEAAEELAGDDQHTSSRE